MSFNQNIVVCLVCEYRQREGDGARVCLKDGRSMIDHANAGYCPQSKFGSGKPDNWTGDPIAALNARPTYPIDGDFDHKTEPGGCGCDPPPSE